MEFHVQNKFNFESLFHFVRVSKMRDELQLESGQTSLIYPVFIENENLIAKEMDDE